MKYRVRVAGVWYVVEVGDISSRPVIAIVDGDPVEIWPEEPAIQLPAPEREGRSIKGAAGSSSEAGNKPGPAPGTSPSSTHEANGNLAVRAPIPGVVVSIAVQPEQEVIPGQELCVLEAMKMKNSIRATRAGRIGTVRVIPGQHVKHRDLLMEYTS